MSKTNENARVPDCLLYTYTHVYATRPENEAFIKLSTEKIPSSVKDKRDLKILIIDKSNKPMVIPLLEMH